MYTDEDGVVHYSTTAPPRGDRRWRRVVRNNRQPTTPRTTRPRRAASVPNAQRHVQFNAYIREAADLYQLPESFIRAVMRVESNFNPDVVSHAGAMGLMQLMPRTAASMGVRDPFDARQNILGGTRYLRVLANHFSGDLVLTIAAYNAGEGAVQRYRGVPPYRETRRYVQNVLTHYYAYRAAVQGASPSATQ